MALIKNKLLGNGFQADYWKIISVIIECNKNFTICNLSLYKDSTARQDDKEAVEEISFVWDQDNNPFVTTSLPAVLTNPIEVCYLKLKTLPEFTDAIDG
jgi:hypothetical protein